MENKKESKWWVCPKCGHEILSSDKPAPIKWTDGHVCYFVENKNN